MQGEAEGLALVDGEEYLTIVGCCNALQNVTDGGFHAIYRCKNTCRRCIKGHDIVSDRLLLSRAMLPVHVSGAIEVGVGHIVDRRTYGDAVAGPAGDYYQIVGFFRTSTITVPVVATIIGSASECRHSRCCGSVALDFVLKPCQLSLR